MNKRGTYQVNILNSSLCTFITCLLCFRDKRRWVWFPFMKSSLLPNTSACTMTDGNRAITSASLGAVMYFFNSCWHCWIWDFFPLLSSAIFSNQPKRNACVSHLSIWLDGLLVLVCFPFDSSNMFAGMASSLTCSLCSISLSLQPALPLLLLLALYLSGKNQSVQLAGRLVTEINGIHPILTGSD